MSAEKMNTIPEEPAVEVVAETPVSHAVADIVIITGMSGAGRTEAMHTFEDLGYFCIDNLPPALIMNMVALAALPGQTDIARKLAIVCDVRNRQYFNQLVGELENLRDAEVPFRIIYLDAKDESLIARYKASRRRHPLCMDSNLTIAEAIKQERELTKRLRALSDNVIDTTKLKPRELREKLRNLYTHTTEKEGMSVAVYSFGFKHGAPADADIVIDVRFLPNPFYIPEMRPLTGLDPLVRDYVLNKPETHEFLASWENLLRTVMPGYVAEGKQHLAIGVGCTGGQHRSVALAVKTGEILKALGYNVTISHRDIALADTTKAV